MAWKCQRCLKRIFSPRKDTSMTVMDWRYSAAKEELFVEIASTKILHDKAVVTHLRCEHPDVPGFDKRMVKALDMPANGSHPLLF